MAAVAANSNRLLPADQLKSLKIAVQHCLSQMVLYFLYI